MNQQQLSEQTRNTKQRSFDHFKFEEFSHHELRYRGKGTNAQGQSNGPQNKKYRQRKDGFRVYQDYLTFDSDEIENFDTDEESSYLKVDPDDSSELAEVQKAQKSLHNATAPLQKNSRQSQNASKQMKVRRSQLTKETQKPINSISKPGNFIKQTANSLHSPFSVPNISQIKKKEYSNKRNSQQFLLNLLQQEYEEDPEQLAEKRRLIQKQQNEEKEKKRREDEYKMARKKQAQQRQKAKKQEEKENRKKAQMMKEQQRQKKKKQTQQKQKKKQQKQKQRLQRQIQRKKREEQRRNKASLDKIKQKKNEKSIRTSKQLKESQQRQKNSLKNSKELQQKRNIKQSQANKSKRVTINDRGRIKYPNDSISGQFQYILPQQLRRIQSSLKKPEIIEESDDEDLFKQQQVPMDIIDYEEQTKLIQKAAKQELKIQLEKAEERLEEISRKQTKKNPTNIAKGKPIIRVSNNQEKKQDKEPFKGREPTHQRKPQHKENQKSIDISRPKKKVKKSQISIKKGQILNSEQGQGRPKRHRTKSLKYWKNQGPIYRAGEFLCAGNLNYSNLLQMLKIENHQKVLTSQLTFKSKQIKIKISLNPKDKIVSHGIDKEIMTQLHVNPQTFNLLEIQLLRNKLGDDDNRELIKVKINNQQKAFTDDRVRFRLGQKFSIDNISMRIRYKFTIALVNAKKVGYKEDQ